MNTEKLLANFEYDMLRALQFCYYVKHISVIEDINFDKVEKEWSRQSGRSLPVGSDKKESYTPAEQALGMYLIFQTYVDTKSKELI